MRAPLLSGQARSPQGTLMMTIDLDRLWPEGRNLLRYDREDCVLSDFHSPVAVGAWDADAMGITKLHLQGYVPGSEYAVLDPFLPYLKTRFLDDGCRNAALLTREIKAQGYTGSVLTVMRRIRTWKRAPPRQLPSDASTRPIRLPAPRTLA